MSDLLFWKLPGAKKTAFRYTEQFTQDVCDKNETLGWWQRLMAEKKKDNYHKYVNEESIKEYKKFNKAVKKVTDDAPILPPKKHVKPELLLKLGLIKVVDEKVG